MFVAIIPFLMVACGALLYALAVNPKLAEIGRLILAAGLFALAFVLAGNKVSF